MELLPFNDGVPGSIDCLLGSLRSSMTMMGSHQLYQLSIGTCITAGKDFSETHVKF